MDRFNIKYVITDDQDGRWLVEAFDKDNKQIGITLVVNTPSEAWQIYMMLNGFSWHEPRELLEKTIEVA